MDARAPWRTGPGCPDWDAIAGARALHPARRRAPWTRWLRHARTGLLSAAAVAGLAWLAEEQGTPPAEEVLALAFLPEAGADAAPAASPASAEVSIELGRFGEGGAFVRIGEGAPGGGLYLEAVRAAAEAGGLAVTRSGLPGHAATALGPSETLPVTLEDRAGRARACTAFRIAGATVLTGLHCAGAVSCAPLPEAGDALAAVAAAFGTPCPASAELDGNKAPPRASPPQPRRDRAARAVERQRGAARPNS